MAQILSALPVHKFDAWLFTALHLAGYLLGAAVLNFLLSKLFSVFQRISSELIRERGGLHSGEFEKHKKTVATTARRFLFASIWVGAVLMALKRELDIDIQPVLAGAGLAGLAFGFAAQNVLKDWIGGFFLLTEGRIRIGDVVTMGGLSGSVEELSLRTTTLRGYDGNVHVISNGNIQSFTNQTLGYSYAVFEVAVDLEEDPDRLAAVFRQLGAEMRGDGKFAPRILADIEIAGLDRFTEQGAVVKARMRTLPNEQWSVGREFNRRLRIQCAAQGITISTAQHSVSVSQKGFPDESHPVQSSRRA